MGDGARAARSRERNRATVEISGLTTRLSIDGARVAENEYVTSHVARTKKAPAHGAVALAFKVATTPA
jgi:hypothetical protein